MGLSQSPVGTNGYVETMNSICTMAESWLVSDGISVTGGKIVAWRDVVTCPGSQHWVGSDFVTA